MAHTGMYRSTPMTIGECHTVEVVAMNSSNGLKPSVSLSVCVCLCVVASPNGS